MSKSTRRKWSEGWLLWPAWFWYSAFLIGPLAIVLAFSLGSRGPYGEARLGFSGANFLRAFDPLYLRILVNSFWLATVTTFSCLILGFPLAYGMARARPRAKKVWLLLLLLPFWTSFVVRAYAIKLLIPDGALSVWVGMFTSFLPFMVLPIYVALEKFDFSQVDAARDLGAPPWRILKEVLVPGIRPGLWAGLVFVFTPALGEFLIPDMLGGAQVMLIGNLVTEQFLKARDWPFGAAISMILIASVIVGLGVLNRKSHA